MSAFAEVLNALYDLIDADTAFKNHVSKHDFGKIAETADVTAVLRVGSFINTEDSFGGNYAVVWTIYIDLYCPYGDHIEVEVESLVAARDVIVDLIQQKVYLGKGEGNADGIQSASVVRGSGLEFVLAEEGNVTHFNLSVEISVYQTRTVTLET